MDLDKIVNKYVDASPTQEKLDEDLAMALTNDISGFVQSDDMNKLQRFFMYLQEVMRNKASKNMELNPLVSMIGRVIEEIKKIGM